MISQPSASAPAVRIPSFTSIAVGALTAAALLGYSAGAYAGPTIQGPGDSSITLGAGLRASYTNMEDAAPDGSRSNDFEIDSVRLFTSGTIIKGVRGVVNLEKEADDDVKILDAFGAFEFYDVFNVWAGRFLPPSDRANLAGPYFASSWLYPGVVSRYPARFAGRDNGVTIWGKPMGGKLVYSIGAFEGHNNVTGGSNDGEELLYAGRVAYAFFDPEPAPGYYVSNTYHGSNDIFTVGAAFMYQKDGIGTQADPDDYFGWNIDALFEKKLAGGSAITLEGAYYMYDHQADCGAGGGACPSGDPNVGGLEAGDGYLASVAYLLPGKYGIGQLQPYARYQRFKRDFTDDKITQTDIGVNYLLAGHNARISATYSVFKDEGGADENIDAFIVGLQLMY